MTQFSGSSNLIFGTYLLNNSEFPATVISLRVIATADISCLKRIPRNGYKTPVAIGIEKTL